MGEYGDAGVRGEGFALAAEKWRGTKNMILLWLLWLLLWRERRLETAKVACRMLRRCLWRWLGGRVMVWDVPYLLPTSRPPRQRTQAGGQNAEHIHEDRRPSRQQGRKRRDNPPLRQLVNWLRYRK